ncbi:MAG: gfo/Idh/MocA family oxidoreductase [Planctomycetota bacterium]|nr:MAG: gfo/Idh/MocA family oxidoreductase [Planctomycetota bacterium]
MRRFSWAVLAGIVLMSIDVSSAAAQEDSKVLRAGIIGLDTSHAPAFAKLLNSSEADSEVAGVKVVAAFPGGSPDVESSASRVEGFTKQLADMGIEIVPSIEDLLTKVDVVLLESVDGRPHLEQVIPVLRAGKPVFIDKPVAGSLADAVAIFDLAKQLNVPCFSSSSLRFSKGILGMRDNEKIGKVVGCDARGPCSLEPHHPDLFWYGIHGTEILFTIMGPGIEEVTRTQTEGTEFVVGRWNDGRIGTFRGLRAGAHGYGATVYGEKAIAPSGGYDGYQPLVVEIVKFFKTGKPPVSAEETLEIYAFMEAADESKRQGGVPVKIDSVMEKARKAAAKMNLSAAQ